MLSQPATGIVLDSNGSKIVYVNELVDVEVQDSTGVAVRQFVAGAAAPNVEVQSLAFIGTDYDTGTAAAGNPTTVQDVLDDVLTSFGTTDWNVLLGGSAVTVQAALSSMYGLFYNVKGSQYGAAGDGIADDTTPIQNAITAAGTAGGGIVFFPGGPYRITAKLTIPAGVSLWGTTAGTSVIAMDHATAGTLEYGAGTGYAYQEIRNLAIAALQSNTGAVISMTAGNTRLLRLNSCLINYDGITSLFTGGTRIIHLAATTHSLAIENTTIYVKNSSYLIDALATCVVSVTGSKFLAVNAAWSGYFFSECTDLLAQGNTFDMSATTSGTHAVWSNTTTIVKCRFVGNNFVSGTTSYALATLGSMNDATSYFVESANTYNGFAVGSVLAGAFWGSGTNRPVLQLGVRSTLTEAQSKASAIAYALSVTPGTYGMSVLTSTGAGTPVAVTASGIAPGEGEFFTFVARNANAAAITYNFTTGFAMTGPVTLVVAGNQVGTITFRLVYDAADLRVLRAVGAGGSFAI